MKIGNADSASPAFDSEHAAPLREEGARILELDGLRAFAALTVVAYHFLVSALAKSWPELGWVGKIGWILGTTSVHVFFVISGFVITTLLRRERAKRGDVSLKAFYIRRFFRIVPAFAAYLLVAVFFWRAGLFRLNPRDVIVSALFVSNFLPVSSGSWLMEHLWTLAAEEQFYLLFPPFFCRLFRFSSSRSVPWLLSFYVLCAISPKIAHELSVHFSEGWINFDALYQFRFICIGVLFGLGGRWAPVFLKGTSWMVPLFLALLVIGSRITPFITMNPAINLPVDLAGPALCGSFVLWYVYNPCAFLRRPVVVWFGACSYSIYLWQQLWTGTANVYQKWTLSTLPFAVPGVLLCAVASYYLVEKPAIRLGRLLSGRIKGGLMPTR